MTRSDINTLSCVNSECQLYNQPGAGNLTIRKEYGNDRIRLLRCKGCKEEFSERRGTALFNTKVSEAKAQAIVEHLEEGCGIRPTARLVRASKETVARLLKTAGRHAKNFHEVWVRDIHPKAVMLDEQWSFVKRSSAVATLRTLRRETCGTM